MHLLNVRTFKLEYFGDSDIPLYAILSHTWEADEISYQDIQNGTAEGKAGYEKVKKTCQIATAHGFDHVWIDTCCIDKLSSSELSEAINSMYRWYQQAAICYVYLCDVQIAETDVTQLCNWNSECSNSRWLQRGWTLQELIAPSLVVFLDQHWHEIGTKTKLKAELSADTGIPISVLIGDDLQGFSVAQKMSWASCRETTRVEDRAYSLMGIFGVHMPLLYGEGERAFARLQEEILKISDDYSIFAWTSSDPGITGPLALSPAGFSQSHDIVSDPPLETSGDPIAINSKGVHLQARITNRHDADLAVLAILPCKRQGLDGNIAIRVQEVPGFGNQFRRINQGSSVLEQVDPKISGALEDSRVCIVFGVAPRKAVKGSPDLSKYAAFGTAKLLTLLLNEGHDPNDTSLDGPPPLMIAAKTGNKDVVQLLLNYGAKMCGHSVGGTPLQLAIANGHMSTARLLIESGAKFNGTDYSSMVQAVVHGNESTVKAYLDCGFDPNSQYDGHQSLLSEAIANRQERVARLLLEAGANAEFCTSHYSRNLLSVAAEWSSVTLATMLLDHGAILASKDSLGRTPLHYAAIYDRAEIITILLHGGARVDAKDGRGRTSLSLAASYGSGFAARLLLMEGADVEARDDSGRTPLSWAVNDDGYDESDPERVSTMRILVKAGGDIDSKDNSGRTPLSWASEACDRRATKVLIEYGASRIPLKPNDIDPHHIAINAGCKEILWLLRQPSARLAFLPDLRIVDLIEVMDLDRKTVDQYAKADKFQDARVWAHLGLLSLNPKMRTWEVRGEHDDRRSTRGRRVKRIKIDVEGG